MPSPSPNIQPISKQLTIVIGLTVVGFMAFGLALSFYRNILFEQTLVGIQQQNELIAAKIQTGYEDLEYFRSAQYKDKFAKENLGKVNPGETLIYINEVAQTRAPTQPVDDILNKTRHEAAFAEYMRQLPVWEHWKLYLFNKEKIEELKRSL
jgi:hypothetical protein